MAGHAPCAVSLFFVIPGIFVIPGVNPGRIEHSGPLRAPHVLSGFQLGAGMTAMKHGVQKKWLEPVHFKLHRAGSIRYGS